MKRRGFFGAMLAGAAGVAAVAVGVKVQKTEPTAVALPLPSPSILSARDQAEISAELRARALHPMWITTPMFNAMPNPNFKYGTTGFVTITSGVSAGQTFTLSANNHIEYLTFPGVMNPNPPTIVTKYPNGDGPQQDLLGFKGMAPNGDYLFETNLGEEVRVPAPLPLSRDISINRNAL